MKRMRSLVNSFVVCGVALAMVSSLAAQTVTQVSAKVVRVKGNARYNIAGGAWQPLKFGNELNAGAIIETAAHSQVDLLLGEGAPVGGPVPSLPGMANYQPTAQQNMVRMTENSRLALDKLTSTKTGRDVVTDTEMDLQAGRIFGTVKKLSAASKYEVKLPSGVAAIRGSDYEFDAAGVVKMLTGSADVRYPDASGTQQMQPVKGGWQFDIPTATLKPLPPAEQHGIEVVINQLVVVPVSTAHVVAPVEPVATSDKGPVSKF